ncbi:hypothetical protein XELAEV_18045934mg [Xenopus laevis]|nr:hypothetical protein XELAEV_18045934mg [Xenopus laevis]
MSQNLDTQALAGCGGPHNASPTSRHRSPKVWNSTQTSLDRGPSQRRRSPTPDQNMNPNRCRQPWKDWSPGRWQLFQNQRRSWGWSPTSPTFAPRYNSSTEPKPFFREPRGGIKQVHGNHQTARDISHYYSPSMIKDPWAELKAEGTKEAAEAQY